MSRVVLLAILLISAFRASAFAPRDLDAVQFDPVPGTRLPLDTSFVDEGGRTVRLGRYFGARPVILVLGYYGCSNLCGAVLQAVAKSATDAGVRAGEDAELVVVSIAPDELPAMALARRRSVGVADARGWHFLTGTAPSIGALTHALGYRYAYDAPLLQYAHAAGITIVAPDGRIRTMLPGIVYPAATLRAALASSPIAASANGPSAWLLCLHYDPQTGRYTFAAMTAVRLAALAALGGLIVLVWRARGARA